MIIGFVCIGVAALGVSASYSLEHGINYFFGYASSIFLLVFVAIGSCYLILSNNVADDFSKECATQTGLAF